MKKIMVTLSLLMLGCAGDCGGEERKKVCDNEARRTWLMECYKFSDSQACNYRSELLFCK